jgi:hypothetical protein
MPRCPRPTWWCESRPRPSELAKRQRPASRSLAAGRHPPRLRISVCVATWSGDVSGGSRPVGDIPHSKVGASKGRAGWPRRSGRAVLAFSDDSPAMLGLVARPRTRSTRCARCARTTGPSLFTCALTRVATSPALLGALYSRRSQPARSFALTVAGRPRFGHHDGIRGGRYPLGRFGSAEARSVRGSERSEPRELTRGRCSSTVSKANAASSAAATNASTAGHPRLQAEGADS